MIAPTATPELTPENNKIITAIPVYGHWYCDSLNEAGELLSSPLIAWGLCENGKLVPITIRHPQGLLGDYCLKPPEAIYARVSPSGDYKSIEAWLAWKGKKL